MTKFRIVAALIATLALTACNSSQGTLFVPVFSYDSAGSVFIDKTPEFNHTFK